MPNNLPSPNQILGNNSRTPNQPVENNSSLPNPEQVLGKSALKKKEVSQSTQDDGLASSVTSKTARKKPLESSVETYNWNGQTYIYRNNAWEETALFEGNMSIPQSQKSAFKKVTDRNKIKKLNYQFKKDVSLDPIDQVYSNYDEEKKDNEYRVKDGNWERKLPGSSSWNVITNEGSVSALNRRYNQSVKYTPELKLKKTEPKLEFADVNTSLVEKTEGKAVETLSKKYGKYGFTFEEDGFLTDYVKVYNKDKTKEITIGFDEKNPEEALKLKNFLEQNASSSKSSSYETIQNKVYNLRDKYKEDKSYAQKGSLAASLDYVYNKVNNDYYNTKEYENDFKSLTYNEMKDEIKNRINWINSNSSSYKTTKDREKDINAIYNSSVYKIYKQKKKDEIEARDQRIDLLYTELQTAKASGNKNAIKNINSKITAYLNDDIIQDQVKNYSMQLNDLDNAAKKLANDQKKYLQSVEDFNKRSELGQINQEEFDQTKKMLDDQAEALGTRADFLMSSGKLIQKNQKKLNVVAGKYVTEKSKAGGFFGGVVNSFLTGVSKVMFDVPASILSSAESIKKREYNYLTPEEKQYYKDKGYSEEQAKNIATNEALKKFKSETRQEIIKSFGSDQTTEEYMKSGNRGFFEKAIYGVAESAPAMLMGAAGATASFTGLAAQSYSSIEDEMLADPDFQTSSVEERAVVAVPYATLMGVLENYGLKNVVKGESFAGGIVKNILASSIKKMPKGASREALQSIMDKEVKNLIAKGAFKIVNGAIAEFETGATQSLVLDIGLKSLYNKLAQSGMTEEEIKNLSGGEMFATPDTLGEVASTVLEDGLAEAVGGATIGTFTTVASGLMNGNISLYNEEDLEYLKEISQDSNFKKIIVANLKTEMLKGSLTKSEAQERLSAMNELASVMESIPDGLTKEDQIDAVNMLSEKNRLTREIQGKDPALVTAQTERINEINNELKTISENAVQKQTTGEVPVQPEATVGREMEEGKPQAEPQVVTEEGKAAAQEEVDQYIANIGAEARIGSTINPIMDKMSNAEYINDNEINNAIEQIFNEVDSLDKSDYSAETKAALSEKLLNIAEKLDNYEFRTKTETVATTKAGTATSARRTSEAVQKIRAEKYFNGVNATVNGQEVTLVDRNGRVEATMPNGEIVVLDTPTMQIAEDGFEFDENDALVAVTVTDRLGNNTRMTGDQALDFAIRDRENKIGVVEQADFDTVYQEVERRYVKEAPKKKVEKEAPVTAEKAEPIDVEDEVKRLRGLFGEQPKFQKGKQTIKVYHGGNVSDLTNVNKENPLFVSEDEGQAEEYIKENEGVVSEFDIDENIIAEEEQAFDVINKLGLKSKEEGWDVNDLNLFELLDPRFETSLSDEDINKVYDELENQGFGAIRFTDTNLKTQKQDIQNIVVFNPNLNTQAPEVDSVVEEMNAMPKDVANFDVPSDLTTKSKVNIGSLVKRFGDKLKAAFKGGIIKDISDYNGIPMIFTISDQLTSGNIKNKFTGNTIDLNGGIGFNLTKGNENNAWANTDKKEAEGMLSRAQEVYSKNKDLFDRLWSEGKLPQGQVPMAIVKMGQDSIKSNEALFRFASDTIKKKFSKSERVNSLNGLVEDISDLNPESKVISFIKENNFKTIDELLDNMNRLKPIGERAIVTNFLFTGSVKLNTETKPTSKPKSKSALALVDDKDPSYYKYIHLQTINNEIQEESTKSIPSSHIIGITGIDVLNPGITQPKHRNYPYGVRGGLIGILESPVHAADIFPEMYSKAFSLNKKDKSGNLPSPNKAVVQSVAPGGAVASTKAFVGAKISTKMNDIQKLLGKLRLAFPSVTVVETQDEFNNALENPEVKKFVKDGEVVYGFTKDGKVFLNPKKANSNTAIHEFSHIWMNFLKENNPKLLAKGYSLLEGTEILKRKIAEFGDVELAREEAMAELIANKGETLIEAGKKSKFKNWLNAVFSYVKSNFKAFDKLTPQEFQNISLNDFVDGSLASLLGGKEITSKEIKNIDVLFSKGRPKDAVDILVIARDNGISDAAIKQYLKEEGFSEQDIKDAFKAQPKAPSVAKVLGKPAVTKVTVNEYTALKDQIRMEARAARDAKADLNNKRKMLSDAISNMVKLGKIKTPQAGVLIKRISYLNLDNPVMVERFTNYAERVFQRADYQDRLSKAFALRKSIRKDLKTDNQPEVVGMAKAFTKIDPSLVEDIDAYMEIAEKVKNAVKPSILKEPNPILKQAANIADISEYSKNEIERQEQIKIDELLAVYEDIEGLSKDMSLQEIKDAINKLKENPEAQVDKESKIREFLNEQFNLNKSSIETMFKTGVDPMTGEEIEFDDNQKDLMKRVLKIDLNEMSTREAVKIVEGLDNFLNNQITSGLESAVNSYEGNTNVKSLVARGKAAKPLRLFGTKKGGRFYSEQLFSLPNLMEKMFGGVTNSIDIMRKMGLLDVINGVNKAIRKHNDIIDNYSKQAFAKGKDFMDAKNIYERGMLSELMRTVSGTTAEMKAEFENRVKILKESIDLLIEDGNSKEKKMGELYKEIYDKLNIDSMDMDVINANASKENLEAVNWWINEWSKYRSELFDVSLSVYNTMLSADLNYTPRVLKKLSSKNKGLDENLINQNGAFAVSLNNIDTNKTGVLMETTGKRPSDRYINLDFDNNNSKALKAALTDINTAAAIRKVDGFINSKAFKKLVPESEDRTVLERRISTYIKRAKGKNIVPRDTVEYLNKFVNYVTALGVGKALAGLNQTVMQTVPVILNTFANAGRFDFVDSDFNNWLNESGMPISNRGFESQSTINSIDKKLEAKGQTTDQILKGIANANQWWLKQLLVKPDVWVARSSFKSYYLQNLNRRGISTDIDWKNHKIDKEAAEYAQIMVDRQQNISDPMLAGEFLASDDAWVQITRKIFIPFASFILNQKARMYNDLSVAFSKTASSEDKSIARWSLAGLSAELLAYQMIGFGIRRFYDMIAAWLLGDEDDEETKRKKLINATKYPLKSIVNDIVSPLPILDDFVTIGLNQALAQYPWMNSKEIKDAVKERNRILELKGEDPMDSKAEAEYIEKIKEEALYQVYRDDNERKYGMIGIAGETYKEVGEISKLYATGEFTDEYQGREIKKKLLEADRKDVGIAVLPMIAYSTGLVTKDVGSIGRNYIKRIKKKAITEKQYERYDAVQKELGRNLKSWEIELVKGKKESETAISEIEFIDRRGGLTERQGREYLKVMKAIGEPSVIDLIKIQEGQTADQILK